MPILAAVLNAVLLLYLTRRLLGVPIGWGRVVLLSVLANAFVNDAAQLYADTFQIDLQTPSLAALALTAVVTGCLITAQMILLTVLEAILPTAKVPAFTAVLTGIPGWIRRLRRYTAIWWILLRRGLTAYLGPTPKTDVETPRVARSLRLALTDAGVTFVKFGQMLSTRADLLPPAFVAELSKLHSDVEAVAWSEVRPEVAAAVDRPLDEVFTELSEAPMAAASVAQIHAATLRDGTQVVVKVQRPKARRQVTADLDILHRLAERLEQRTGWGRSIGSVGLAEGFAESLHEELDYRVEIANMRGVAASSGLIVPRAFDELSSSQVIVMERVAGKPLSSATTEPGGAVGRTASGAGRGTADQRPPADLRGRRLPCRSPSGQCDRRRGRARAAGLRLGRAAGPAGADGPGDVAVCRRTRGLHRRDRRSAGRA